MRERLYPKPGDVVIGIGYHSFVGEKRVFYPDCVKGININGSHYKTWYVKDDRVYDLDWYTYMWVLDEVSSMKRILEKYDGY
jgi:hypothetical protein